jgi:ATP-dependent Clp protease, protease subunit
MSSPVLKIWINDFYDSDVMRLHRAIDKCQAKGQDALPVMINSMGGSVINMLSMVDIIEAAPIPVATVCVGAAMSAGAVLLAAGTKGARFVAPNATVMVHGASTGLPRMKRPDIDAYVEIFRTLDDRSSVLLDKLCGQRKGYWKKLLTKNGNADLYLTAEEAVEHGLADHVEIPKWYTKPEQTALVCGSK